MNTMVGNSSRSRPVFTSSGLVMSTSMPRSNCSAIQSSRLEASTLARSTATLKPSCSSSTRSEEHTSELQSLMRISYAVFCLKKKKHKEQHTHTHNTTQQH